jgi:hypothetical protein
MFILMNDTQVFLRGFVCPQSALSLLAHVAGEGGVNTLETGSDNYVGLMWEETRDSTAFSHVYMKIKDVILGAQNACIRNRVTRSDGGKLMVVSSTPLTTMDCLHVRYCPGTYFSRCSSILYLLDDDMETGEERLLEFLGTHEQPVLIFGFTYIIWKCFFKRLQRFGYGLSEVGQITPTQDEDSL